MGKMSVALMGKPLFTWTGTSSEIDHTEEAVYEGVAGTTDLSPEEFALSCLAHLPKTGLVADPTGRQFQMMTIVWWILSQESSNPDHPGKFRPHLPEWDFSFDLRISRAAGRVNVSLAVLASSLAVGTA